jgi:hypothetical protein
MHHDEPLRNPLAGHAKMFREPGRPPAPLQKPLCNLTTPSQKGRLPPVSQK